MFTEKYIALQPERRFTKNQLHEPIKFIPVEQLFRTDSHSSEGYRSKGKSLSRKAPAALKFRPTGSMAN